MISIWFAGGQNLVVRSPEPGAWEVLLQAIREGTSFTFQEGVGPNRTGVVNGALVTYARQETPPLSMEIPGV